MATIIVSELCYRHIAANAQGTFRSTGVKLQDGSWSLPVGDDVLQRIHAAARQGETTSDTILRLLIAQVAPEGQGRVIGTRYH